MPLNIDFFYQAPIRPLKIAVPYAAGNFSTLLNGAPSANWTVTGANQQYFFIYDYPSLKIMQVCLGIVGSNLAASGFNAYQALTVAVPFGRSASSMSQDFCVVVANWPPNPLLAGPLWCWTTLEMPTVILISWPGNVWPIAAGYASLDVGFQFVFPYQ